MRVFGFDIGTTSVGSAVIDYDEAANDGRVLHMGARIFPESRTPEKGSGALEPLNKQRRAARMLRRQLRRRRKRRRVLNEAMSEVGLLPKYGTPEWATLMKTDPYALRANGLTARLDPHEIGRALYQMAKHRGFRPRAAAEEMAEAKSDEATEKKKEEGKVNAGIAALRADMGGRTLGAFLAGVPDTARKRGRYLAREMVDDEFRKLWEAQRPHHPALLTRTLFDRLHHVAFHQRPVFWRLNTIGTCHLTNKRMDCLAASWRGQRFRMLQMLNNVRLVGGNARPLTAEERAIVLAKLGRQKEMGWAKVRTLLKLPKNQQFNFEVGGEKRLVGNAFEARMIDLFDDAWATLPSRDAIRRDLADAIWRADYRVIGNRRAEIRDDARATEARAALAPKFHSDWGISAEQAKALSELRLPGGWLRHSGQAIERLLPELEKGFKDDKPITYGDLLQHADWAKWRNAVFPDRLQATGEILDRLPSHPKTMPETRNPTVTRALNELRKVANNLVAVHGKPDLIRIELTREASLPRQRRLEMLKSNREREGLRKKAIAELQQFGIHDPAGRDIEKWLLWEECGKFCPYTGLPIGIDDLFRNNRFQVEHIFPRSRTLDNGFGNKTLCETDFNIHVKGKGTIWEAKGADTAWWGDFETRIANSKLPDPKKRRLLAKSFREITDEDFSERQLADTGYIARMARDYLKQLFPDTEEDARRVETRNGRLTSQLRHQWGLDPILNPDGWGKSRADHRHHAIDAVAVACSTWKHVKALGDWFREKDRGRKLDFATPWAGFREQVKAAADKIVVSHKVKRKVSGALHAQTSYGDTGDTAKDGRVEYRWFVARKPVTALTKAMIDSDEAIRDPEIRRIIRQHVADNGGDPKKAFATLPMLKTPDGAGRPIKRVRVLVKQQQNLMVPLNARIRAYADTSTNHHMAIWRRPDGEIDFEVVALHEAVRRLKSGEKVVKRERGDGCQFLMSLMPGDMLEFPDGNGRFAYRVVEGVWASSQSVLADHASADGTIWKRPTVPSLIASGARKVTVDPIGRIRPAND